MNKMSPESHREFNDLLNKAAEKLFDDIVALSKKCKVVFPIEKSKSQMSQLEQVGLTAPRFGDIVTYVKRQTGKNTRRDSWARQPSIGVEIVEFLEKKVREEADNSCSSKGLAPHKNLMRLKLAGICLRNLNSAYQYESIK